MNAQTPVLREQPDRGAIRPTTFNTIDLDLEHFKNSVHTPFLKTILMKVERLKDERLYYYENLRRRHADWVNDSRSTLSLLGATAVMLTGAAAALRFMGDQAPASLDKFFLLLALFIFGLMSARAYFDKGTERTGSYFRHIAIIFTLRDLWTKFQFDVVHELEEAGDDEKAFRLKIYGLVSEFVTNANKVCATEFSEWQTGFVASLASLQESTRKSTEDVTKILKDLLDEEKKAQQAAAAKSGKLEVTLDGVKFDGDATVIYDGKQKKSKSSPILIQDVAPGTVKVSATANDGAQDLTAAEMPITIKAGETAKVTLTLGSAGASPP